MGILSPLRPKPRWLSCEGRSGPVHTRCSGPVSAPGWHTSARWHQPVSAVRSTYFQFELRRSHRMTNPRVCVLTILYPSWLSESERSMTHTILRRRSDGPLLVRERDPGPAQRAKKDWGKLRYTSGKPHIQAIFTDAEVLARVQAELKAFVPDLPAGVVRRERRRRYHPDLPCMCVLPCPKAPRPESMAGAHTPFPSYTQVATCPRPASGGTGTATGAGTGTGTPRSSRHPCAIAHRRTAGIHWSQRRDA